MCNFFYSFIVVEGILDLISLSTQIDAVRLELLKKNRHFAWIKNYYLLLSSLTWNKYEKSFDLLYENFWWVGCEIWNLQSYRQWLSRLRLIAYGDVQIAILVPNFRNTKYIHMNSQCTCFLRGDFLSIFLFFLFKLTDA